MQHEVVMIPISTAMAPGRSTRHLLAEASPADVMLPLFGRFLIWATRNSRPATTLGVSK